MSKTGAVLILFITIVGFVKADVAKRYIFSHKTNCKYFGSFTSGCHDKPPDNPPTITCDPQPNCTFAPPGLTKAVVNFDLPHAQDKEDGTLTPMTSGPGPGSTFPEGITPVIYTAKDSKGKEATCVKEISVVVIRCSEPSDILHGNKTCTGSRGTVLLGATCSFTCDNGYEMKGKSSVQCTMNRHFEPQNPKCDALPCQSPPVISNGVYDCSMSNFHYGDSCYLNCSNGYRAGKGNKHTMCQASQTWSKTAQCIDDTPPIFDNCPLNITLFSDRGFKYSNATWSKVTAIDPPTGRPAKVVLVSSEPWGTHFNEGEHQVEYHAYDEAGNRAVNPCSFKITVETLRCPTPNLHPTDKQHLMVYGCKEYIYGTVCPVSCQSGYPLGGPDHIVCEKDNSFPPISSWKWNETSGIKPYCMVRPCTNLTAPVNGALVCDKWMHGRMCQMQCNNKFNFPVSAPHDGMFVCGTDKGIWLPTATVPDCVSYSGFSTMRMKAYFYYNGSCSGNQGVQQQIKTNFIKALKNSFYGSTACTNVTACKPDNVQVICGKVTRHIYRRGSADGVTIKFDVVVAYDESKGSGPAALGFNDQRLHQVADKITKVAQSGALDLDQFGLKMDKIHVEPQSASLDCPEGRMADMSKGACVGCAKGSYLDDVQKTCVDCPVGSYQDEDASASCNECPAGMSTASTGSASKDDCRGICTSGFISPDGLEPCSPCPMGTFQGMPGNQHCNSCPKGMITSASGSTEFENCLAFDISLGVNSVAIFKPTQKALDKITYAVWLYLNREMQDTFNIATWQDPTTGTASMAVVLRNTIEINAGGSTAKTSIKIPLRQWTHFAIQADINTGEVSLFMDGYVSARQHMKMTETLITKGHNLVIRSGSSASAVLSRLIVFDDVVSTKTISRLAASCVTLDSPHLMDLTDMDKDLSDGAQHVIPSVCGELLQRKVSQ